MKAFASIILCLLLSICAACTAPTPAPPPTPPPTPKPPAPVVNASYLITEFDAPGHVKKTWEVSTFRETKFPPSVTFTFEGQTITLKGSYQIDQFLTHAP